VGAGAFSWLATVAAPTVTLAVSGLTAATEYRFRVRAVDAAGNMSAWGPTDAGLSATTLWSFVAPSTNNGEVSAIIADGAGGWYVGGSFTSITDSVATYTTGYTRLVRLRADGTIDAAFSCPVSGTVQAMALDSTGLYIAGSFTGSNSVGTSTRGRIARVRPFNDASPGAVDAWNPGGTNPITAIVLDSASGKIYACGQFFSIGGAGTDNNPSVSRNGIARMSTGATGIVDAWNPRFGGGNLARNMALDVANGRLYVGGTFTTVGGTGFDIDPVVTRNGICRLTTGTNATLDAWNPNVTGGGVIDILLDGANGKLYVGGLFTSIGAASGADITPATTRNRIARLTTGTNATLDAWNPNAAGGASPYVRSIAHDAANGFFYLGGTFTTIGGTGRNLIARVSDGATATLDAWNPNVSAASGTAIINATLLYPANGKAIIAGNFDAIVNQVDSLGNDIAGLDV
jgi:hypothetical protein